MATLTSTLRVALIDAVSGPSRAITATLGRLNAAASRNAEALNSMRGRVMDSVGMGYALARSLSAPIRSAAAFETQLEDIGQKANIPQARLAALGAQLRKVGRDTNQAGSDIAGGMDTLMGLGASESDALNLLPDIGRAATAYRADITDLSNAGYAALDNLKVPAKEFGGALDAMAAAGKAGAFELKDMSQYFPALGAGYQALGQKGVPAVADLAAALQIVRKGAGDSGEAANNLKNVLQKIKAPQTVKAFKSMGVNLEKELTKAARNGMTPIEAIAEITNKALKGDLSKMGNLFSDAQVQAGLRPLIQNIDLYRQIRADAMKAQGVVQEDYDRRIRTGQGALKRMQATIETLSVSIGAALLPALSLVIDKIAPIVTRIAELAEQFPQVTAAIVGTTAALIGLRIALTGLRFVGLFTQGGLIAAAMGATRLAGALLLLLNPIALVRAAFVGLRVALLATGVGAIAVGLAAAGLLIYNNWNGLTTMFRAFGSSFLSAIEPVQSVLQPAIDGTRRLYASVSSLLGPVDGLGQSWFAMGRKAGKAVGDALVSLVRLPAAIAAVDWSGLGRRMLQSLTGIRWSGVGLSIVTGIRDGVAGAVGSITSIRDVIVSSVGSIDWGSVGNTLSAGVAGVYNAVADRFRSINWSGLGEIVGSAIRAAFVGTVDIANALLTAFYGRGGGSGVAQAIGGAIRDGLVGFDWLGVGKSIIGAMGSGLLADGAILNGIVKGLFKIDLAAVGADMIQSLWNGVMRKFDEMIAWFREIPARVRAAIGRIDLSNVISWPSLPSFLGGGTKPAPPTASNDNAQSAPSSGALPAIAGARRSGGPVEAGKTYQVNEDGTELFTPDRSGVISPHDAYRAAMAGSGQPAAGAGSSTSVVVHLQIKNAFSSAADPRVAAQMAQQTADKVRAAVEATFSD